ncbi:alpha/beta hydrolase [Alphaproteobacteria bacterium]|nr:alpha/beta hydrolase [Alphaproteobacteria bacterium]
MPKAAVRGITVHYDVLGDQGPWVALSPGGRNSMESVRSLAQGIAGEGHRVVIFDRRNCGATDVMVEGDDSEYEIWADDLHELLSQLNALPVIVGGSSSGCRLSLLFALRYPEAVKALLLWRVTGGGFAAARLAEKYYGLYIEAARHGGMAAVCETEEFAERIADNPSNWDRLMAMDPDRFIAVMSNWLAYFEAGAELPVIGVSESDLRSIAVPTCIVPGNDKTHPVSVAETARDLIAGSEYHTLMDEVLDVDTTPFEDWDAKEADLATIFIDFLKRL